MNVLKALPAPFQGGVKRHRQIDLFTDSHPAFKRSVGRFSPPLRRFGGILADVIYDHCLARRWSAHSELALTEFTARVYASLDSIWADIPVQARPGLAHMRLEDWLGSYRELSGIARALERISRRMKRPFDSTGAMDVIEQELEAFDQDFNMFFPELKHHLGLREVQPPNSAMS
ncbi:MAG: acyl carrier protein phosphodiesterase [Verrucomicrobiaceae bacterium]|nr:acyl carrier protein phosphodiesterase [Verrucomicrobiaceae bacterium]